MGVKCKGEFGSKLEKYAAPLLRGEKKRKDVLVVSDFLWQCDCSATGSKIVTYLLLHGHGVSKYLRVPGT